LFFIRDEFQSCVCGPLNEQLGGIISPVVTSAVCGYYGDTKGFQIVFSGCGAFGALAFVSYMLLADDTPFSNQTNLRQTVPEKPKRTFKA
jgi:hypothetical protein